MGCSRKVFVPTLLLNVQWFVHFISASSTIFNILNNGYCKEGRIQNAFKLNKIVHEPLQSDAIAYNEIINDLCKNMLKEADQILVETMRKGLSPNSVTYNTIINGHCKEDGIVQALAAGGNGS